MGKQYSKLPPEFRHKITELVRSGRSANDISREFEVSRQTIANWLRQDDVDTGRHDDGLTTVERDELTRLRRENKRLKIDTEILSKAAVLVRSGDRNDSEDVFGSVRAHKATFPVTALYRNLAVSASGYYARCKREPSVRRQSDALLGDHVEAIYLR